MTPLPPPPTPALGWAGLALTPPPKGSPANRERACEPRQSRLDSPWTGSCHGVLSAPKTQSATICCPPRLVTQLSSCIRKPSSLASLLEIFLLGEDTAFSFCGVVGAAPLG